MKTKISVAKINTCGNSLVVRILKKVADALKLHDSPQIKVSLDESKIVLKSESNPFFDLSQDLNLMTLLSKITSKNKHSSDEEMDNVVMQEV